MKPTFIITKILIPGILAVLLSCNPPKPKNGNQVTEKKNFIVLLDLSDRIIVQPDQPERDKQLVGYIYNLYENDVKKNLYIRSRDEIKVVIAPQRGVNLPTDEYEDRLFINMDKINIVKRRSQEEERKNAFMANLDTLYRKARFSDDPKAYYGADIWQYFDEDLRYDYVNDTLTKNYLFIITDGYPIVGKNPEKLQPLKTRFPNLNIILVEAAPREKDLEWDHVMSMWNDWFNEIRIPEYTIIKRQALSKEEEMIADIVSPKNENKVNAEMTPVRSN